MDLGYGGRRSNGEVADGGGGKASVVAITAGAMVTWMFGSGAGGEPGSGLVDCLRDRPVYGGWPRISRATLLLGDHLIDGEFQSDKYPWMKKRPPLTAPPPQG